MNTHIDAQIVNMLAIVKTFEQSCNLAAMQNDGRVDKSEEKMLKKLNAATQRFMRDLEKIR